MDPDLITVTVGWALLGVYTVTAVLCIRARRVAVLGAHVAQEPRDDERRSGPRTSAYRASVAFWALLAATLLFVGLDRPLGLMEQITATIRRLFLDQGWYGERRAMQLGVAMVIGLGGLAMLTALLVRTRELLPRHAPAFAGAAVVVMLLLARTLSYHQLDAVLYPVGEAGSVGAIAEIAAAGVIGLCAAASCRWARRRPVARAERRGLFFGRRLRRRRSGAARQV
ncbi:MAG: hypothetical protein ACYTGP_04335 [Planctomycetota bacterium]|jgi:hypothetical protein